MLPNTEGFLFPEIIHNKCVSCGLCEKVCPVINPPVLNKRFEDSFVAQSTRDDVLNECTSGGFIDALYQFVLEEMDGYAVGVSFDNNFMPAHKIVKSYNEATNFRNSKYAQSDLGLIFSDVKKLLAEEKKVVFVGTPCQVAGLKCFLQKDYDNLITADLVCRSIPSPLLWEKYLEWQEEKHKSKITTIACRKKTYGYHSGTLECVFENKKKYSGSNRVDYFMKSFHGNICSRESCYSCKFKTVHRCSDFTVFDSWQPERVALEPLKDNDLGFSNVLVNSAKAKKIVKEIKNIKTYSADPEKMFEFTGGMERKSVERKPERDVFYKDLNDKGFFETVNKYSFVSLKDRIIEKLKPIRYFVKIKKMKK